MEKKICSYETLFVVNGTYSEEQYKTVCEKFVNLINDNATDVNVNEWGKRKLAYTINYATEGYYVLVNFKSEPTFPHELTRVFGITEGIIRHMTLAVEEKAPAVAAEAEAVEESVVEESGSEE